MFREFYNCLLNWKEKNILTPLMVVGARQVGKTYIIDTFCRDNFNDYIYINLLNNTRIVDVFASNKDIEEKIKDFKLELKRDILPNTIIFVDEVLLTIFCFLSS